MVLTQTAGQGKLTTENFNQLADAVPGASGKLQQALLEAGAYTGNFREAMEKGEITAEEFNAAVMDLGMTDVAKEAATSTATIEGAWGNLEAALVSGGMSIVDQIKPALTDFMGSVATGAEKAFSWINDTLIPGIQGVWDILANGQFDGSDNLFGLEEDSGIVDFLSRSGSPLALPVTGLLALWCPAYRVSPASFSPETTRGLIHYSASKRILA